MYPASFPLVIRYQSSPYGSTTRSVNGHKPRLALPVREAVEQQVVRIMKALLLGSPGELRFRAGGTRGWGLGLENGVMLCGLGLGCLEPAGSSKGCSSR